MCNVPKDWPESEYKDIETIQWLEGEREHRRKEQGVEDLDVSDILKAARFTARDNGRTPIQVSTVPAELTSVECRGKCRVLQGKPMDASP
jgi:hypothetical protein